MQLMEIRQTFNIFLPIFMILVCPAINCVNNFRDHNGVKLAMLTLQNFDRHNKVFMQLNQCQYELKHEYDLFCCEPKLALVALSHPQKVVLYPSLATI